MHFSFRWDPLVSVAGLFLAAWSCAPIETEEAGRRALVSSDFGSVDGEPVALFTLTNQSGARVGIIEYGGIVVSLTVPDRDGKLGDVVMGYDTLDDYLADSPYFGCITGRYANRIDKGRFEIDGTSYQLAVNFGSSALHGGIKGFDKVVWKGVPTEAGDGVTFSYVSPDGEEGYPGTLTSKVTYTWTDENELRIEYEARTDKPTIVNLTNHSYFNLKDGGATSILGHQVRINADSYTPVDEASIPTGDIASVEGTPLDFREPVTIGTRIGDEHEQLRIGLGYDHNYVLNRESDELVLAATVYEPKSGRVMEVETTEPGMQFYSGNYLDGHHIGKGGVAYEHRSGFCLETQHYPNSPNQADFPSTVLRPGETYATQTVYRFSTR